MPAPEGGIIAAIETAVSFQTPEDLLFQLSVVRPGRGLGNDLSLRWRFLSGRFLKTPPLFFRFWGIPFILVGAYMVAGRFVWDARRRAKTYYGVTDRHILIVYGVDSKKTTTLALKSLPGLTLDERYNGDGDVVFDTKDASHVATGGIVGRGQTVPAMFELIPQAREVYNIIRKAQGAI